MTPPLRQERPAQHAVYSPRVVLWLAADFLSLVGDQLYFIALSWSAIRIGGPAAAGTVLVCAAIPRGVLMLVGGAVVDRIGARRVAVASDVLRAVIMVGCLAIPTPAPLGVLVAIAVVFGIVDAFFYPATGAMSGLVVPKHQLTRIQGIRSLTTRAGLVVGAPASGFVLAAGGQDLAFAINAVTFAASAAALMAVRLLVSAPASAEAGRPVRDAIRGLREALRSSNIWIPLLALAVFEFTTNGLVNVGLPDLADTRDWGARGLGLLLGALGVGAAAVAAAFALTGRSFTPQIGTALAAAVGAVSLLGLLHAGALVHALAAAFGIGVAGALMFGLVVPHLQATVQPHRLGQMMSLVSLATVGITPLSQGAAAASLSLIGTAATFLTATAVALALALVVLLAKHQDMAPVEDPGP